jgi:hypothetical protein
LKPNFYRGLNMSVSFFEIRRGLGVWIGTGP